VHFSAQISTIILMEDAKNVLKIAKNVMKMDVYNAAKIYSFSMNNVLPNVTLVIFKKIKNAYHVINNVSNAKEKIIVHLVYLDMN